MCYHFKDHDTQDYIDWFTRTHNYKAYYHKGVKYYVNAFDHLPCAVTTQEEPACFREMEWGFVPHWVKTIEQAHLERNKNLNARCETVLTSNNFKQAIIHRKCLIVASGFY